MREIKFQYDGKKYTLREDGRIKREGQLFFQKGWVVNGFILHDASRQDVFAIKVPEVFDLLKNSPNGTGNPLEHLKGAMINGSTLGNEGFREGRTIEDIHAG